MTRRQVATTLNCWGEKWFRELEISVSCLSYHSYCHYSKEVQVLEADRFRSCSIVEMLCGRNGFDAFVPAAGRLVAVVYNSLRLGIFISTKQPAFSLVAT